MSRLSLVLIAAHFVYKNPHDDVSRQQKQRTWPKSLTDAWGLALKNQKPFDDREAVTDSKGKSVDTVYLH